MKTALGVSLFLILLTPLLALTKAAVLSIDYGAEWSKIAILKSGRGGMDIVLNDESKRKTSSSVYVKGDERALGSAAAELGARFPSNHLSFLKVLIGKTSIHDPEVQYYKKLFGFSDERLVEIPAPLNGRATLAFVDVVTGEKRTVEELVGMYFNHLLQFATKEENITSCVILIPVHFGLSQRQAILDAASLGGLPDTKIISSSIAAALHFGKSYKFQDVSDLHVIYDVGAFSSVASVVSFRNELVEGSKTLKKPVIEIISSGFNPSLGGKHIDALIQEYFAQEFIKQRPTLKDSLLNNPRALGKLLKEANRVKHILTVNSETAAYVEGLLEDVNFNLKVTQSTLNELCAGISDKYLEPLKHAIEGSGKALDDIKSILLIGGGSRVKFLKDSLKQFAGDKVSFTLNSDESVALGGVLKAADLSPLFHVKEFILKDSMVYPLSVTYEPLGGDSSDKNSILVFPSHSSLNTKKNVVVKKISDLFVKSTMLLNNDSSVDVFSSTITGSDTFSLPANHTIIEAPKIRFTIHLDEQGFPKVTKAISVYEVEKSIMVAVKKPKQPSTNSTDTSTVNDNINSTTTTAQEIIPSTSETANAEEEKQHEFETRVYKDTLKHELNVTSTNFILRFSEEQKTESLKRISELIQAETLRKRKNNALNSIESIYYELKNSIEEPSFTKFVAEVDFEKIKGVISNIKNKFLENDPSEISLEECENSVKEYSSPYDVVMARKSEYERRPSAFKQLKANLHQLEEFAKKVKELPEDEQPLSEEQLNGLPRFLSSCVQWIHDVEAKFNDTALHENPPFSVNEMLSKSKEIEAEHIKLSSIKKPLKKKPVPTPTSTEQSTTNTQPTPTPTQENNEPQPSSTEEIPPPPVHAEL